MNGIFRIGLLFGFLATLIVSASARPTIGLLLKVRNPGGFWGSVEQGAKEAAEEAGVDLIVKGATDAGNFGAQIKMLDGLVNQKIDALVIMPVNPQQLLGPLKTYAANGLKIVVAETELPEEAGFPYVGYDQTKLATTAAQAFGALLKDGDEVTIFRGASDQIILQRDKVIIAKLKEMHPKLQLHLDIYATSNETSTMRERAVLMLNKYPNSKMFIATSSLSSSEVLATANALGKADKVRISGFGSNLNRDTIKGIEGGTMQIFIAQVPKAIGYKSVTAAVALIQGKSIQQKTDIDSFVITKENLNTPAIQALRID